MIALCRRTSVCGGIRVLSPHECVWRHPRFVAARIERPHHNPPMPKSHPKLERHYNRRARMLLLRPTSPTLGPDPPNQKPAPQPFRYRLAVLTSRGASGRKLMHILIRDVTGRYIIIDTLEAEKDLRDKVASMPLEVDMLIPILTFYNQAVAPLSRTRLPDTRFLNVQ